MNLLQIAQMITHQNFLNYLTTKCGAQGLINGQFQDLSYGDEAKSLEKIIKIHELKTARLLEISLVGGLIATGKRNC